MPQRLPPGYACNFATLRDAPVPAQAVRDIETAVHDWLVANGHPRHPSFLIRAKNAAERARDARLNRLGRPCREVFLLNGKTWAEVDAMLEEKIREVATCYVA